MHHAICQCTGRKLEDLLYHYSQNPQTKASKNVGTVPQSENITGVSFKMENVFE